MASKIIVSLFAALLLSTGASAHTVWLETVEGHADQFRVRFGGHAGKLESYDAAKLKSIDAQDAGGKTLAVKRSVNSDGVLLSVAGKPALIAMYFDNGIFSYVGTGRSIEKPMNEVPGATRGTAAVKYHKTFVAWPALALQPLGQPFEVVPLDKAAPRAGVPMRVRVLKDGVPVAGVKLGRGEEGTANDPVTDADGVAAFVPVKGFNKLWAGKRYPVANEPRYTELSYEYLLGFTAE